MGVIIPIIKVWVMLEAKLGYAKNTGATQNKKDNVDGQPEFCFASATVAIY